MAGVCVRANHCAVWGVCLVEETARAALALPPRCAAHPAPAARLSALLFNAPRSGRAGPRLAAAVGALRAHPAVLSANPMCRTGDALTGPEDGPPSWYAEVVARFDCPAEGKAWLLGVDAAWAAAGLVEPFGQP